MDLVIKSTTFSYINPIVVVGFIDTQSQAGGENK